MISVDEARDRILSHFRTLDAVTVPVLDALGMVLAEDVVATFDIPPHDNAAMDGYAVIASDTLAASESRPVRLPVIEEVPAGRPPSKQVESGTAIRIMTGAPLPLGADAVVPFENTGEGRLTTPSGWVDVLVPGEANTNLRRAGEDVRCGQAVIRAGSILRPAEIGVVASLGRAVVRVVRRPRVAILSTGDEVMAPGEPLSPGKIYDANGYSVAAQVRAAGGEPVMLGIARDDRSDLIAKIERGLDADFLVTSAGVSVGDYDIVKNVLRAEGSVEFWLVAMRPGKPLAFGTLRGVPHIGLPGNPVASMISFELFGRPAIMKMRGLTRWERPHLDAVALESIDNYNHRRSYYRACLEWRDGHRAVRLTGPQGSGILTSMVQANCLLEVPEAVRYVEPGDTVRVVLLDGADAPFS